MLALSWIETAMGGLDGICLFKGEPISASFSPANWTTDKASTLGNTTARPIENNTRRFKATISAAIENWIRAFLFTVPYFEIVLHSKEPLFSWKSPIMNSSKNPLVLVSPRSKQPTSPLPTPLLVLSLLCQPHTFAKAHGLAGGANR
ncbi:hypothetical protein MIND_01102700 [Mycena indigotica]|uniref:Uncharacterized protein n=1 Tax=Mycena indigotica TaxID=2126181 RepID=A0A8H6S9T8_9AGAR|nr:uncharacterized protein MIND_01102700 [Mycena indigotica]KAF7295626.1 hypothetical protein MIND_01102700 [Mycena indigotica]